MSDDSGIAGDQRNLLGRGLSGEQAVERIALTLSADLDVGKASICRSVRDRDRKQGKSLCQQLLNPLVGNLQLAE